jgi:hypothetical protein
MKTISISIAQLFALACLVIRSQGFMLPPSTHAKNKCPPLAMVGGKGWENSGYLDSLGGNDQDREQAKQEYNQFKENREAFTKRQQERINTPGGQGFLRQQQLQQRRQQQSQMHSRINPDSTIRADDDDDDNDSYSGVGASSGGSAFRKLMQRSQQMQQQRMVRPSFVDPMTGMEQSFVLPLEPDDFDKSHPQTKVDDGSGGQWSDVE